MTDTTLIIAMLVMCFFPLGLKCITQGGMILGRFGTWMDAYTNDLPEWLRKPLWTCPRCMLLWYGFPMALLVMYAPWYIYALPVIVTAVGIQDTLDR